MNSLSKLAVGDAVAMLAPMTAPDLDGCRHMYWVKGEVASRGKNHLVARHEGHEARFSIESGEQANGRHEEGGPGRIMPMNDESRMLIAEGALKKSNYERRNQAHDAIHDLAMRLTTEALERTAAFMAGEDEMFEAT
jgi:hypothetical protein